MNNTEDQESNAKLAEYIARAAAKYLPPRTSITAGDLPVAILAVGLAAVAAWQNNVALAWLAAAPVIALTVAHAALSLYAGLAAHEGVTRWRRSRKGGEP